MVVEKGWHHLRYFVDDSDVAIDSITKAISESTGKSVNVEAEKCYHLIVDSTNSVAAFEKEYYDRLSWLLRKDLFNGILRKSPKFSQTQNQKVTEIGLR